MSPSEQQARQQALAELLNSQDAWGLIVPFLEHNDVNVQFYGAHIAGVKIVRDWLVVLSDPDWMWLTLWAASRIGTL